MAHWSGIGIPKTNAIALEVSYTHTHTHAVAQPPDPQATLALFNLKPILEKNSTKNVYSAHKSLTNYLLLWARQLELNPDKGVTTPVTATDFRLVVAATATTTTSSSSSRVMMDQNETTLHDTEDDQDDTNFDLPPNVTMTLRFRPPKRYLSYKEQKNMEKGILPDRKGGKVDAWSPGGVELLVLISLPSEQQQQQQQQQQDSSQAVQLQVMAKRCDIDGDTIIKYASERAIVRRLTDAVRIWEKVRAMP